MKKVLIIGPAPHNVGGISIHIRRLSEMMKNDYDFDYIDEGHIRSEGVFNLRSGNVFMYLRKVSKADVVHINSGIWSLRALNIIACKVLMRKKVVVTIHRDPNIEPHVLLTKFLVRKCNHAILVNKEGYNLMYSKGKCKYTLLPAFLPPIMKDEPDLPILISEWIKGVRQKNGTVLMCSNASVLTIHDGYDLYGLDMCIEAVKQLNKENSSSQYCLLFVIVSNPKQKELLRSYKKQIESEGLGDKILIWEGAVSFVRIIEQSDLVLRPTNTDGDAISIREALYLGRPVVASDVVKRPEGTFLFRTRDTSDFIERIEEASNGSAKNQFYDLVDYYSLYKSIYD